MSLDAKIIESHPRRGYSAISEVFAYYTAEEKAARGRHCESWTPFGKRPEAEPYRIGQEREFIAKVEAENPGKFVSYLIAWVGCE